MMTALKPAARRYCLVCDDRIPSTWLMCRYHWDMVPIPMQNEIHWAVRCGTRAQLTNAIRAAAKHVKHIIAPAAQGAR